MSTRAPLTEAAVFPRYIRAFAEAGLDTHPSALLDLGRFRSNATAMTTRAAGTTIRVASKSLRVRSVLEAALAEPGYSGVLAFTLPEALWLAENGIRDIVVAYPTADREALRQLLQSEAREHVTVMVDSTEHLELLRDVARSAAIPAGARFRVCVDIDASYAPARHRTSTLATNFKVGPARSPRHNC